MPDKHNIVNIDEVIERIKDVICHEYKSKVLDKNVSYELGINPGTLSSMKSRGLIPYDELTMFAIKRKVNINWLFFGIGDMEMSYA